MELLIDALSEELIDELMDEIMDEMSGGLVEIQTDEEVEAIAELVIMLLSEVVETDSDEVSVAMSLEDELVGPVLDKLVATLLSEVLETDSDELVVAMSEEETDASVVVEEVTVDEDGGMSLQGSWDSRSLAT